MTSQMCVGEQNVKCCKASKPDSEDEGRLSLGNNAPKLQWFKQQNSYIIFLSSCRSGRPQLYQLGHQLEDSQVWESGAGAGVIWRLCHPCVSPIILVLSWDLAEAVGRDTLSM